jgi:hypothetical protein
MEGSGSSESSLSDCYSDYIAPSILDSSNGYVGVSRADYNNG